MANVSTCGWSITRPGSITVGSMVVLWDSVALRCDCLQRQIWFSLGPWWCCEIAQHWGATVYRHKVLKVVLWDSVDWGVSVYRDKLYLVWVHGGVVIQHCVGVWLFTKTGSTVLWDSIALVYDCLHRQISFSHFILSDVKQSADFKVTTL